MLLFEDSRNQSKILILKSVSQEVILSLLNGFVLTRSVPFVSRSLIKYGLSSKYFIWLISYLAQLIGFIAAKTSY